MLPDAEFKLVSTDSGYRLVSQTSGRQFGEHFQEACRSDVWKAALVVFEKYKRKWDLQHQDLKEMKERLADFIIEREAAGKKCNYDFLVQQASAHVKKKYEK